MKHRRPPPTHTLSARPDTMRAITQYRYGNADVLRAATVPRPAVGDDQVLVRVRAAGLDRGTEHLLTGKPYAVRLATGVRRPKNPVPGRDVAGIVAEVGADVVGFTPGDEVYGVAPGSFAEYAVTTPDKLSRKPADITFAQAAVMPISAGTALQALTDAGGLQAGQSVLITGASGGVGSYAVQIAHVLGAEVTGVCSSAKADYVRAIGAHHVLTYPHDDWADGTRRWDLIIDIAGNPTVRQLRRALTPHGTASSSAARTPAPSSAWPARSAGPPLAVRRATAHPTAGPRTRRALRAAHPARRSRPAGASTRPDLPA